MASLFFQDRSDERSRSGVKGQRRALTRELIDSGRRAASGERRAAGGAGVMATITGLEIVPRSRCLAGVCPHTPRTVMMMMMC